MSLSVGGGDGDGDCGGDGDGDGELGDSCTVSLVDEGWVPVLVSS